MDAIPFVDAHMHLWDLAAIPHPWLSPPFGADGPNGDVSPIAHHYLLTDYRADAAAWRLAGAVHVEAGAAAQAAVDETRWLEALAEHEGLPSAIVACAALDDPNLDAVLEAHAAASGRLRGVRHIVNWHPDPRRTYTPRDVTRDAAWQAGFGRLARHGLSFDLQCYPGQLAGLAPLIARHPDTPVIVNHAGMPVDQDEAGLAQWRAGMAALAELPHVAVKLSGFGFIRRDWTTDFIRPLILTLIDLFGTQRCLAASDFPTDKLFASFDAHLGAYHQILAGFSRDERLDLFGRNAARLYRIAGLDAV